jgi:hypothetical protein
MHGCGAGRPHRDVLVFKFRGRPDIDLWYEDEGCATLDNGYIIVEAFGNPSFFLDFSSVVDRLER